MEEAGVFAGDGFAKFEKGGMAELGRGIVLGQEKPGGD
jgi:hypothetical protein